MLQPLATAETFVKFWLALVTMLASSSLAVKLGVQENYFIM